MGAYSVTTEGEEALAAATAETLVQVIGSASTKSKIVQWSVAFDSVSPTAEPVLVRLARQTTSGTSTGATEVRNDPDDPTALCTSFHSFSAEPTLGEVIEEIEVYPGGIPFVMQYPMGLEPIIDSDTASRVGIIVTAPAVVNAVATLKWVEGG